jgi:chaperone required for assembly of F1-ATPase
MIDWLKNKLIPPYKPNPKEQLILDIVTNLCEQSDTDILMAPISGRYFLVNKRLEYWVRVWEDGITITNHKFTFTNSALQSFQSKVINIVEKAIEKSRDEFEEAVFQNEVDLLENIISNIKSK